MMIGRRRTFLVLVASLLSLATHFHHPWDVFKRYLATRWEP
jgi:hypothetical protein